MIADRTRVRRAVVSASMQTAFPRSVHWRDHDVAQGDAGLALACAQFDRCCPGKGWDVVGHEYLSCAVGSVQGRRLPAGLFNGLAGLAFVTGQLSRGGARYVRLARTIEGELDAASVALARSVDAGSAGLAASEFDAICGLAGIAAHLLARSAGAGSTGSDAARDAVLGALVRLLRGSGREVPRWATPPEFLLHAEEVQRYPRGNLNCGLAHGVPGPLAMLSLALAAGVRVDGLHDAVREAARWLAHHRVDDRWGVNWPVAVTLPDDGTGDDAPSRAAWCYGSPGLARALWLAGVALEDDGIRALAIEAMAGVYARPVAARQIDSPTFCHGVAGLLQVTLRFRQDTGDAMFDDAATALVDQLLDAFEPDDSLLGFRSVESGGGRVEAPGLLDGAPGVALVLLAAATPVEPTWDRLFLLA
ncbi:MAG: lanthionine synthetase C family protein [Actinomycetota bacterium]|nr:lanthionine synthetase C family protein [Actinomycetota bacterium]